MLVEGRDLLGNAGEEVPPASASSRPTRLPTDTEGCIGDGTNPGIPNTSTSGSSSEA